jgi:hypothetical protein
MFGAEASEEMPFINGPNIFREQSHGETWSHRVWLLGPEHCP